MDTCSFTRTELSSPQNSRIHRAALADKHARISDPARRDCLPPTHSKTLQKPVHALDLFREHARAPAARVSEIAQEWTRAVLSHCCRCAVYCPSSERDTGSLFRPADRVAANH